MRTDRRADSSLLAATMSALTLLVLAGVAYLCLSQSRVLQLRLDHDYVGGHLTRLLAPPLQNAEAVRSLRPALDRLLRRPDLGLNYLAVLDSDGVLLASAGVLEHLQIPFVPQNVQAFVRATLYRVLGSAAERRIFDAQRHFLGSVEYSLDPGNVEGVRLQAINDLRLAGFLAVALMLPVGTILWLALQRYLGRLPGWANRADPSRRPVVEAASDISVQEFRGRAGLVMDGLGYALIIVDRSGRVTFANETAERLTGWSAEDANGRLVYSVYRAINSLGVEQPNPVELALQQSRGSSIHSSYLKQRRGESIPVEVSVTLLRLPNGAVDGAALLFKDASQHQREFEGLRREVRLSQAVTDHLDEGLLTTDMAGVVRSANARAASMFAYTREELIGFTVSKLMPVPFLNTPSVRIVDYIAGRRVSTLPKVVGWRKDATTFPVDLWVQPMRFDGSDGLVVIVRDVSERLRGENLALRLGRLLDGASEEIYIFDAESLRFLELNRGARHNLGYGAEDLSRMTPLDISEELDTATFDTFLERLREGESDHVVYRCRHKRSDGSSYPVEVSINYSRNEEPPVFMAIASDITERVVAEEKLNQLAHFDALTGLPNRLVLYDRIEQARLAAERASGLLGVFFLDLDRFKQINDTHGHEVGDAVLKSVAERLRSSMRPSDTVARLAGDEFVILAPGLHEQADAEVMAQKLLDRFKQPLDLPGLSITSRPSIGITLYPLDDSDIEGLLRHADAAMYQAKQAGRACYRVFSVEVEPERRRQIELERELASALTLNQLQFTLQPVLCAEGRLHGFLTEVHWDHPEHGVIGRAEFWRAAGRAGQVSDVELWQVRQACEATRLILDSGLHPVPQVVSLSGWQLRNHNFVAFLSELLERHQVPAGTLVLALTPDGLMQASERPQDVRRLTDLGVRFALRDFNVMLSSVTVPISYALAAPRVFADEDAARSLPNSGGSGLRVIALTQTQDELASCHRAGIECAAGSAVAAGLRVEQLNSWMRTAKLEDAR